MQAQTLRLGLRTLDGAEVLSGLAAGDVVLLGSTVPAPGERVRPDTAATSTTAAAGPSAGAGTGSGAGAALSNAMGR